MDQKVQHRRKMKHLASALLLLSVLSGCNLVVMSPSGDIAAQQSQLITYATMLMLIVIVPVVLLSLFFAYKYRASNKDSRYEPDWHHSTSLEIIVWSVPLAIIICLAGLTWVATHRLDPYASLQRISADKPIDPDVAPMVILVAAMDWKWLFIYPEQGIATINEVAAVVDRPIEFRLTSTTVMNSFYIPALAGMIYAMSGMETRLNAVINEPGEYDGFASNYNGEGFSQMRFKFHGMSADDFGTWAEKLRQSPYILDRAEMMWLDTPSIAHPVTYYRMEDPQLWDLIISRCYDINEICNHNMMLVDALGGGGVEGLFNRQLAQGMCASEDIEPLLLMLREDHFALEPQLRAILMPEMAEGAAAEQTQQENE